MKKIMLAAAFIAATFTTAIAGERPSNKAENDQRMKQGRQMLTTKTNALEADLKKNNSAAVEAEVMDILAIMRQGVAQTRSDAEFNSGATKDAGIKHMLDMEQIVHNYLELMHDINTNGVKLLETAKTFQKTY